MKPETICCYCISKYIILLDHCMHYINRAGLTACEVDVLIFILSKIHPPPSLRSHLSSLLMGHNGEFAEACRHSGQVRGTPDVTSLQM